MNFRCYSYCAMLLMLWAFVSPGWGDEISRTEREKFFKKAKIVYAKDLGVGATKPLKVKLNDGKREMKAIFKSIDLRMEMPTRFGSETVGEYSDSYKHVIAAYELDKLLGLGMLPVAVERRIKGKKGSLREWVDDVMPHYGHGTPPPEEIADKVQLVWFVDY